MTLPAYVGRYRVDNEIARGGFATVVRAWDEELESFVAIKILHPNLADDEDILMRFLEEARLLRRIRSPNVVTVHDVGRLNDGRPYFVMDFADRATLADRIRPGDGNGPDPRDLTVLIDALADGLTAIHEAGLVHRDVKPANILFQLARRAPSDPDATVIGAEATPQRLVTEDERVLVGDLGIAKDLAKHGPLATIMGGTPLYEAPEQRDGLPEITPAADIYSATALLWHVLTAERPPNAEAVPGRLPGLPAHWHTVVEQGMALDPGARFTTVEAWRSAIHDVLAHEVTTIDDDRPTETRVTPSTACPYKGLAAYQPEDAGNFFGREALIDELVRRVQLERVLVVGGPSGSGKSSLVRAGLIPALRAGALLGSESWRIALLTPGRDPLAELHHRVAASLPDGNPSVSIEDLLARPTMARHLGEAGDPQNPLLLCIDQFEELFTLAPETQRSAFITALSAMTDPADSTVRVVISVRADFYAACATVPWLAERITGNQVLVGPMTRSDLRRAISEPARRAGLYVERNLVEAIIDEAGEEAGSLPLIAHALVETWVRRQGNTLTVDGFRDAGGVAGAISQTADATYQNTFGPAEREATKRLFLRLVTPGEETPDTRRILGRSEIDHDTDAEVMRRVVERLTEVRLLTVDDTSVQIAHEALLRTWPRLRDWIEESRDDLRTRQRIARAAAEWDAAERDADLLYRGTPLLSAQDWMTKSPDLLGELDLAFLEASTRAKAEAEAIDAERRQRARRARRFAIAVLSFLSVGASAASVVAFLAWREARQNEEMAERATAVATERFAGALGAAANGLVESDPLLALALAAEAVARAPAASPGYDARAAMIAARRALAGAGPFVVGSPISAGDALAIAMTPDGSLLAAGRRDGSIELIDATLRRPIGPSLQGHAGGVQDLDFAPDGRRLVSVGDDGAVHFWSVADGLGRHERSLGQTPDILWGVRFDPQGTSLATAGEDGTVRLWGASEGAAERAPLVDVVRDFLSVSFSPDGRALVAGTGDGAIFAWALPSAKPLFEPIGDAHSSDVWELEFSPSGDRFATASSDATAVMFDYPSGRILGPAFADAGPINAVAFSPDGELLFGGGLDGALHLWHVDRERLLASAPGGHSQAIADIEVSQDGRRLATLGRDQLIRLWSMGSSHALAQTRSVPGEAAKGLAISPDGLRLAAGDNDGTIQVWRPDGRSSPQTLTGHGHQVWALAFSPDGALLASGDRSGEVRLWDLGDGRLLRSFAAQQGAIWSLLFTAEGSRLVTASDAGVGLWNVETASAEATLDHPAGRITRAALSPDGALLATVATDGRVRLWDLESASVTRELAAEDDVVWSVAFSPDGRHLATASSDEVVALWDVESGQRTGVLTGHSGGATDLAYLADGVTLAVTDRSGQLHLWDAPTGRRLAASAQGHQGASWRIAVHPDGERFATSGDDGQVQLWNQLSLTRACAISRPAFDRNRRDQYLGLGEDPAACQAPFDR
ncbi:WD40 repeat domain-containing serine/threonine protein kinase [Pelagibius sp.]|uniref:WD40 repeat domain-containing serine/threonine protein kinase n=1 Tax=Pelagibius sp. TaxID=1931238 RepID=UPI0026094F08|nr:protein kinase [Pelagibius sp.]